MSTIWIKSPVDYWTVEGWKKRFFQHSFFVQEDSLPEELLETVEVIFTNEISQDIFHQLPQLHWIHTPSPDLHSLHWPSIEKKENLLITTIPEENIVQQAEYIESAILYFAKNLSYWCGHNEQNRKLENEEIYRSSMWCMKGKIHLQIGLSPLGEMVAKRAREMGMVVWGVQNKRSFHPLCDKTFGWDDLHSILPSAHVVCFHPQISHPLFHLFEKAELDLIKEGAILVLLDGWNIVDREALQKLCEKGKFRGVIWDGPQEGGPREEDPLWKLSSLLLTLDVASLPKEESRQGASIFAYNLRQWSKRNWRDMKYLAYPIGPSL